jgi:hypothetical protein
VNAKAEDEGKISVTGKIGPDHAARMVALENYDALPVMLNVAPDELAQQGHDHLSLLSQL